MEVAINNQKITPFLWFDQQAEEAMNLYVSVFPNSTIKILKKWPEHAPFPEESCKPGTVQTGIFTINGLTVYAFDAGPMFKFNYSISFFVTCSSSEEIERLWNLLIERGEAMMPLDSYEWSEKYGWLKDRYGVTWQFMKGDIDKVGQSIAPLLLFSGKQRGRAEEAMKLYTSIFKNSAIEGVTKYQAGEPAPEGYVKHAQCKLEGETFMFMDSGIESEVPFNEAISFFVQCRNQNEVDYFWEKLLEDGQESACGWLKDKFGVSWQIVPQFAIEKIINGEPDRLMNMMLALSKMKKLDMETLQNAYDYSG